MITNDELKLRLQYGVVQQWFSGILQCVYTINLN